MPLEVGGNQRHCHQDWLHARNTPKLGPDGRQPDRLAILTAQKERLLLAIQLPLLVPPVGWHQTTVVGEGSLELEVATFSAV
jgi:hypothetical protein